MVIAIPVTATSTTVTATTVTATTVTATTVTATIVTTATAVIATAVIATSNDVATLSTEMRVARRLLVDGKQRRRLGGCPYGDGS